MCTINDYHDDKVRNSRNLRGLYDHARRVARRHIRPLFMSVESVVVIPLHTHGAHVTVTYHHGDIGQAVFASHTIACNWAKRFAEKRGGTYKGPNQ